ncbi:hypothetical protein ACFWBH_01475 [Streptomyces sp. NPDC059999]|uniref:hypothetical protein n=1 Tax=Streptomyces sp. NPDC059999 TaxID=3347030 RepID=UPI0036ACF5A3
MIPRTWTRSLALVAAPVVAAAGLMVAAGPASAATPESACTIKLARSGIPGEVDPKGFPGTVTSDGGSCSLLETEEDNLRDHILTNQLDISNVAIARTGIPCEGYRFDLTTTCPN